MNETALSRKNNISAYLFLATAALGVYGFWFIFGDIGKAYFGDSQAPSNIPPPPPNNWQ